MNFWDRYWNIFFSLGGGRGWMVERREFDVCVLVLWQVDYKNNNGEQPTTNINNRSGSLCSILNCPGFHRHCSLSINELKIIMIEKLALKAENPVINKSVQCFLKVLHIIIFTSFIYFWRDPAPHFFIFRNAARNWKFLKVSPKILRVSRCGLMLNA